MLRAENKGNNHPAGPHLHRSIVKLTHLQAKEKNRAEKNFDTNYDCFPQWGLYPQQSRESIQKISSSKKKTSTRKVISF